MGKEEAENYGDGDGEKGQLELIYYFTTSLLSRLSTFISTRETFQPGFFFIRLTVTVGEIIFMGTPTKYRHCIQTNKLTFNTYTNVH